MDDIDKTIDDLFARLDKVNERRAIDPAFDKEMRAREKTERKRLYPGMTEGQIRKYWDLKGRLEDAEKLGLIVLDLCGHRIFESSTVSDKIDSSFKGVSSVTRIFHALGTGKPMRKAAVLSPKVSCNLCDQDISFSTADGFHYQATEACPLSKGLELVFELNVLSGKMVVSDRLRGFRVLGDYNVNTLMGRIKQTRGMEKIGCAHAFVGDSYPSVYKAGLDRYVIGNPGYSKRVLGEKLFEVSTELWWYSIADYDEYFRRNVMIDPDVETIEVKPGVYRFTHHVYSLDFQDDLESEKPTIYADIEWVRPPDEIKDFRTEYLGLNFTASQIIHRSMDEYPDLHHGPDAVQGVADDIFCVIGGGGTWHENGFILYDPDTPANEPEVEIPVFDKRYQWYPLCDEYSALSLAAKGKINLNPSFAALAKNILRCMLEYGVEPFSKGDEVPSQQQIQEYLDAINCKYPDA